MELCSMLCGSLNGREVWGRMDICICVTESLRCSLETITTLLTGYIPIENKKLKKKRGVKVKKLKMCSESPSLSLSKLPSQQFFCLPCQFNCSLGQCPLLISNFSFPWYSFIKKYILLCSVREILLLFF